jgi:flavin reductase (DIM6/NTAB) family NADH-FMN oxidoreductase RutF
VKKVMLKSLGAKTILYPTPVSVIGTYDKDGKPNVMTAAWVAYAVLALPALLCP